MTSHSEDRHAAIFGDLMRTTRLERKIGQRQMARELGITQPQISRFEQGKNLPMLVTAVKIARYLDLDVEKMLDFPPRDVL